MPVLVMRFVAATAASTSLVRILSRYRRDQKWIVARQSALDRIQKLIDETKNDHLEDASNNTDRDLDTEKKEIKAEIKGLFAALRAWIPVLQCQIAKFAKTPLSQQTKARLILTHPELKGPHDTFVNLASQIPGQLRLTRELLAELEANGQTKDRFEATPAFLVHKPAIEALRADIRGLADDTPERDAARQKLRRYVDALPEPFRGEYKRVADLVDAGEGIWRRIPEALVSELHPGFYRVKLKAGDAPLKVVGKVG